MPAGRPTIPIENRKRDGTYNPTRHGTEKEHMKGERLEQAPKGKPVCLKKSGYDYYQKVCAYLLENNALYDTDLEAIETMCLHHQIVQDCAKELKKGMFVTVGKASGKSKIKNPAYDIMKQHSAELRNYQTLFGISPSARAKIKFEKKEDADQLTLLFNEVKMHG
jgi:P27 family predicted phage terminase small subunit